MKEKKKLENIKIFTFGIQSVIIFHVKQSEKILQNYIPSRTQPLFCGCFFFFFNAKQGHTLTTYIDTKILNQHTKIKSQAAKLNEDAVAAHYETSPILTTRTQKAHSMPYLFLFLFPFFC